MKKHGAPNRLNVGNKAMHDCYARGEGRSDSLSDAGATVPLDGPPREPGVLDASMARAFGAHVTRREPVDVKGKGVLEMFWVDPVRGAAAADTADSTGGGVHSDWSVPIGRTLGDPKEHAHEAAGGGGRMFDVSYRVRKTESRELKSPVHNVRLLMSPTTHRRIGEAHAAGEVFELSPRASRRAFTSPKPEPVRLVLQASGRQRESDHPTATPGHAVLASSILSGAGAPRHGRNHASHSFAPARRSRPWWSASEIVRTVRVESPDVLFTPGPDLEEDDISVHVHDVVRACAGVPRVARENLTRRRADIRECCCYDVHAIARVPRFQR
jgi:hypothetical protein